MIRTTHGMLAHRLRALVVASLVPAAILLLGATAQGTAISQNNYAVGGNPGTGGYPNMTANFFRWEQSEITYMFAPSFTSAYGAAGEAKITAAFNTWTASLSATTGPNEDHGTFGAGDIAILGVSGNYDLQSVALHEIGHAIGFDHPNGSNSGNNYNVDSGDWDQAVLPGGSHPIMWSTIDAGETRQNLTLDDIYGAQFLYSTADGGVGAGDAGGPVFGLGPQGLNFSLITSGTPDILIEAKPLTGSTLASTINSRDGGSTFGPFTAVPDYNYTIATTATNFDIIFRVPEPSTFVLFVMAGGCLAMTVMHRRKPPADRAA